MPLGLVQQPPAGRPGAERHRGEHPEGLDEQAHPDPLDGPRGQRRPGAAMVIEGSSDRVPPGTGNADPA